MRVSGKGRGRIACLRCGLCATVALGTAGLPEVVAPAGAGPGNQTFVSIVSDPYDWVGRGQARYYHPGNATISLSGTPAYVSVAVRGGNLGEPFEFVFAAPEGRHLVEGAYELAGHASYRQPHLPGLDIATTDRDCEVIEGRFDVRRIESDSDGDVRSLWIVYEQHCSRVPWALFGEIRFNVPGDAAGTASVGPRHLRWPDTDRGEPATDAPVTVVNDSASAVSLGSPVIEGATPGSFHVGENECSGGPLPPGGECIVWVGFETSEGGPRSASLRIPEAGGTVHEVALRGWVLTGTTRFTTNGEPGDWVDGGNSNVFTLQDAVIIFRGGDNWVSGWVQSDDGGTVWDANFSVPHGDVLTAGTTYVNAVRSPSDGSAPAMWVGGTGRGCNEVFGEFTVTAIGISESGELDEVRIEYEQHCERADAPALRGVLEYRVGGMHRPRYPDPSIPAPDGTGEPGEVTHDREISLRAGERRLAGRVRVADETEACSTRVGVLLQRLRGDEIRRVAKVTTDAEGRFGKRLRVRPGTYRAVAPRERGPGDSTCARAVSAEVRV